QMVALTPSTRTMQARFGMESPIEELTVENPAVPYH
ncbi:hypothetical protein RvY_19081, partial [Ramazzottius varieornatus]